MTSDTDDPPSTSDTTTSLDSDSAASSTTTTSADSVGSRRSTRLIRKKRHDDSLQEELESKHPKKKKSIRRKAAPKKSIRRKAAPKKEFGVKPNPVAEIARKANATTAKRLASLLKQEEKLKAGATLRESNAPLENELNGDHSGPEKMPAEASRPKTPTTSSSHVSSSLNSTPQFSMTLSTKGLTSTPNDLTPRKAKLAQENEALKAQVLKLLSNDNANGVDKLGNLLPNTNVEDDESGNLLPNTNVEDDESEKLRVNVNSNDNESDDEKHVTVVEVKKKKETNAFERSFEDGEEHGDNLNEQKKEDEATAKKEKKQKSLKKRKHMNKKSMKKKSKKKKKSSKRSKKHHKRRRHASSSSSSSDTSTSSSSSEELRKKKKIKRAKIESEQLLFNSESSDVEEIVHGSGVFMKSAALSSIKRTAKSHTAAARAILVGVFTTEALTQCSLKGNSTKGPLGKIATARPPLYGPGLDAVLEAAARVAKIRKLEIVKETIVNHELSTKQSELRSAAKLQAALLQSTTSI